MVYAAVKACPVPWGALKQLRRQRHQGSPRRHRRQSALRPSPASRGNNDLQDAVAVVADSWFRAKTALDLLPIEWDSGANATVDNAVTPALPTPRCSTRPARCSHEIGDDTLAIIAAAATRSSAPSTTVRTRPMRAWSRSTRRCSVTPDRVDVWSPTQNQSDRADQLVADQAGRDTKDVYVHTVFLGGAFGGDGGGNTAVTRQATELSNQLGRPVKVIWTREEDINHDKQRPPHMTRLTAVLGDDGLPTPGSRAPVVPPGASRRAASSATRPHMPYLVPNRRHETHSVEGHIPVATHRAPGTNQNAFMIEQFVDEVALAGGWDPLDWRLQMTEGMPTGSSCSTPEGEVAGFRTDLPKGQGMGIAIARTTAPSAAACATVTRQPSRPAHRREGADRRRQRLLHQPAQLRRAVRGGACAGS